MPMLMGMRVEQFIAIHGLLCLQANARYANEKWKRETYSWAFWSLDQHNHLSPKTTLLTQKRGSFSKIDLVWQRHQNGDERLTLKMKSPLMVYCSRAMFSGWGSVRASSSVK
jgi:hypothetical protein